MVLVLFAIVSCGQVNEESTDSNNEVEVTECDCKLLNFDKDYNRFYLKDRKKPFTGVCDLVENGVLLSRRHYKDGKYHGDFIDFYPNGQEKMVIQYKNHFMNGDVKHYSEDGQLIGHSVYKQSVLIETKL